MATAADLWTLVEGEVNTVCVSYNSRKFLPLLEADFAGYLHYALLADRGGDASRIHLDTRLSEGGANKQYDVAIGTCLDTAERKRQWLDLHGERAPETVRRFIKRKASLSEFRPVVQADLVLELKAFVVGFTS